MITPIIKTAATASDEASIIDVLVRANWEDPAARWVWPDSQQFLMHFPSFVRALGGKAFAHGSAYYVDGYTGAALWLPPDVHLDENALIALLERTVSEQIQKDFFPVLEQMAAFIQVNRTGICHLWVSTRLNKEKDLVQRYCNTHLCSLIATTSLPILNLQIQGIFRSTNGMVSSYLAPFR